MGSTTYILLFALLVAMFFGLTTLARIEEPLKEQAQLPRCQANDVVISAEFLAGVRNFASAHIMNGTGEDYFNNRYLFLGTDYSTVDCTFVVKYVFTYDELHEIMSVRLQALSQSKFEVLQTSAFLRPVYVLVSEQEAEQVALEQNISYDYHNLEIVLAEQTIVYRFYKETLTQGIILVLEIDAQSKQIIKIERPRELIPIV